jgi:uncharacterized protein YcbX
MSTSTTAIEVKVTHLERYPLKSAGGIAENSIELAREGFVSDRNWMIVDSQGNFQSQRNRPSLARFQAVPSATGTLHIQNLDTGSELSFNGLNEGKRLQVKLHSRSFTAIDCGEAAANWLAQNLGADSFGGKFRLVQATPEYQPVPHSPIATNFADAHPFLLCTEESLAAVNDRLNEKALPSIGMDRFRPNIVIAGVDTLLAFAEYGHKSLIRFDGDVAFDLESPCKRCSVTTVNQKTAEVSRQGEPLRTLANLNTGDERGAFFGVNMSLRLGAMEKINIGDSFYLIK